MDSRSVRIREAGLESGRYIVHRFSKHGTERVADTVTREEPLEIRVTYSFKDAKRTESVAITMRTPGNEQELAAGFLFSEGILARREDIVDMRMLGVADSNEILLELHEKVDVEAWRLRRSTVLSSACGLCGKRAIESIPDAPFASADGLFVKAELIYRLPSLLVAGQAAFTESGGLHAAGLVTPGGELLAIFEDVGRHNALDKLVGSRLLTGNLPLRNHFIFMSSRGSFELVQKSLAAGCSMLVTIGAPSTLAIEFARSRGMTLVGFVRDDHFNVYAGEWRVTA